MRSFKEGLDWLLDTAPYNAHELVIRCDLRARPRRIEAGDEIVVITWLHLAERNTLEVHPRDDPRNPPTGVFATRSQDRPNPLGLHRVSLMGLLTAPNTNRSPFAFVDDLLRGAKNHFLVIEDK